MSQVDKDSPMRIDIESSKSPPLRHSILGGTLNLGGTKQETRISSATKQHQRNSISLIDHIDKYKEFKKRVEQVEKQIKTLLDQAYNGAREKIQTSNNNQTAYQAIKNYQAGVKLLLEQQTIATDNLIKVTKQNEKIEDYKKVEISDETYEKLYSLPHSSFSKFKERKSKANSSFNRFKKP